MDDSVAMEKRYSFEDIGDNIKDLIFLEYFSLLAELEEMAWKTALQDQVQVFFIVEEPIEFDNVGVI